MHAGGFQFLEVSLQIKGAICDVFLKNPQCYPWVLIPLFRYDVWLVDWRLSCDLPWAVFNNYTMEDCAAFDYPAAINEVLEITKQVLLEAFFDQEHCILQVLIQTHTYC